jgi:hypothetical protein
MNDDPFRRPSDHPVDVLRSRATELRTMAQTARTMDMQVALQRLATRFDDLADQKATNGGRPEAA